MVALLLYKRLMHGMVSRMFFFSFFSALPTSQNMNIFILMKKEVQKLKKYTHYFFNYLEAFSWTDISISYAKPFSQIFYVCIDWVWNNSRSKTSIKSGKRNTSYFLIFQIWYDIKEDQCSIWTRTVKSRKK